MSPAAVGIRSPDTFSSKAKPFSTPQNPNTSPDNFTAVPRTNHSQMHSSSSSSFSSSFGNAGDFDCGFGFASWSGYHPKSASARPRPRFFKVRKQLNGKVRTAQTEAVSDFNPFRQSAHDSGRVSSGGNLSSSGSMESLNRANNDTDNNNTSHYFSFVFGGYNNYVRDSSGNVEVQNGNQEPLRKSANENVDFEGNMRGGMEKLSSEKYGKFAFVFGANGSDAGLKSNLVKGDSNDFGATLNECGGEMKVETGRQGSKDSTLEFAFGATKRELTTKLDSENGEYSRDNFNANKSKTWNGNCDDGFFVFGASSKGSSSEECKYGINSSCENFGVSASNGWSKDVSDNNKNIGSSSSANSIFILQDDLKKLDISSCDTTEDSDKKVNSETVFVFGSSEKASSPLKKPPENGPSAAAERTFDDSFNEVHVNGAVSCNSCNEDNVGISCSNPFTFQEAIDKTSDIEKPFQGHVKDGAELNGTNAWSSLNLHSKGNSGALEETSEVGAERNEESCSTSTSDRPAISFSDFKTTHWDCSSFKANLFPEGKKKMEFGVKSSLIKEKMLKKMKGKSRKSSLHKHCSKQHHVPKQRSSQENQDSQCYSPMDFSPYQETTAAEQSSKETSQASEKAPPVAYNFGYSVLDSSSTMPEADCLASAQEGSSSDNGNQKCSEPNVESFGYDHEKNIGYGPSDEYVCESETASATFKSDWSFSCSAGGVGEAGLSGTQDDNHTTQSSFNSGLEDDGKFSFSATSTSGQVSSSFRKRQIRRKSRVKIGNTSFIITPSPNAEGGSSSVQFSPSQPAQCQQKDKFTDHSKEENERFKQGFNSSTVAIHEACEMWRLRGNQAYRNNNLSKAEEFYTHGINSVPSNETSRSSIKPLVLCYSNRAATRISLGRMREALADCLAAAALDPNFLKVYLRAANCHLLLGETENAVRYFTKCLGAGADVCLDRRITIDAADGLQRAQRVNELTNRSAELLEQKSTNAASSALDTISEALSISSYSENLLQMKAEALSMLRKYEEAIELCEQSLYVAEKNFAKSEADHQLASIDDSGCYSIAVIWRWHLMAKSYFYMGKLEKALDLLQKLKQIESMKDKHASKLLEMSISLAVTIQELLRLKNAGNEAVHSGRYADAVEHYSMALSSNVESRPFAAICFCNRAAAHQALGQIADAIADCSLAMALDENYIKAVSRRATLHEMIRDYGQAASDLQRLISILEKQSNTKSQSGSLDRTSGNTKELRQAQRQLSSTLEEAKRGIPLDLYLILGVKPSDSASDVKKAYRKAALRHHPDKAGQFLARSESGDEGRLWKEIAEDVHKDADRLFKMIGEAYAVLSDTAKRSEYDLEEEIRKAPKESKSSPYERPWDEYGYSYERSTNRRYWRANWKANKDFYSRW
ncbi:Tetratricopeptide TPR-1 [Corchorus capsularis]|uniref:Tetratricopeptide TPR-1 n=1 Tax=Corchorus capsularis TaxID=210143 RepID=A0A1R3FZ65_COCAP|nr:Tetratricopeptide TPR-1 [Corchorus capsularis]